MPVNDKNAFLDEALNSRKEDQQFRTLSSVTPQANGIAIEQDGNRYINFCSNDYLGLARHPEVIEQSRSYLEKYGAGSTASRLISGTFDIHTQLEKELAKSLGREAALIFNSGFQANSSILGTVTDRHSLILADKLSHNSLLQGALAGRASFQRFHHNNIKHLESLLQKAEGQYKRIWIVTETVFSMDGDRGPIKEIANLADKYNAHLFVDDAHAVGVWGDRGLGLAKDLSGVDILLGTCGKAFGSFGAYVACSNKMRDYLINFCPGFIFTTALPPAVIGAISASLKLIPQLEEERAVYHQKIKHVRKEIQSLGFDTGPSTTQIIPIILGSEKATIGLADLLKEHGILASAIRPPTVPKNSSRIRLTLSLSHTDEHIKALLNTLKKWING